MLEPSIAMLDEIDSGLDVDALKIVANAVVEQQVKKRHGSDRRIALCPFL